MDNRPATGLDAPGRWALVLLVSLLMAFGPALPARADNTYKVQPGDTLISIAARYGVSVDAIVTANSLASRSTIYAGQALVIPSSGSSPSAPRPNPGSGQATYTVQQGDTLSDIALQYGTTIDALVRANTLGSTIIYAGQTLVIPSSNSTPSATPPSQQVQQSQQPPSASGTYVVQPGDGLIGIASKLGVTQQALASANGLQPFDRLFVGQTLRVPAASQPPATANTPAVPTAPSATSVPLVQPTTSPQPVSSEQNAQPGKPVQYTVQPGDSLSSIAARFNTTVESLMALNKLTDRNFLRIGQVLTIVNGDDQDNVPPATPATTPSPEPTAPMGQFGLKWVDVNLTNQTMIAFEGQTPVFSSKVSSGVPRHPTVQGIYRIYAKYKSVTMQGGQGTAEYYYLPNVPYTMYFYSGYALHGAYWHNNFGQPMSHGCVNLSVDAAKWMYDWAPVGTMVVTHK